MVPKVMRPTNSPEEERRQRFTRLMLRYHARIERYCRLRLYRDPFVCEEVVQDVFTVLYERLDTLQDDAHLGGWLYKTADNLVKKALSGARRDEKRLQYADWADERDPLLQDMAYEENYRAVEETGVDLASCMRRVLERLSAEERLLWRAYFREGGSIRTLCGQMHLTENALKSRIHRLRQKLKTLARQSL